MSLFYTICRDLLSIAFSLFFRWRAYGQENVPSKGSVILASNHASFLDPPLIGAATNREVNFLARESLFRFSWFAKIIRKLNAVPVDRDGAGGKGLKIVLNRLKADSAILLFPEGTRTSDGEFMEVRSGIGLTVVKSGAPVVPIRIFGTFEAWNRHQIIPRIFLHRVAIRYGEPLRFEEKLTEAKNCSKPRLKEIYQEIADEIMAAIAKLEEGEPKEKID